MSKRREYTYTVMIKVVREDGPNVDRDTVWEDIQSELESLTVCPQDPDAEDGSEYSVKSAVLVR